MSRIFSRVAVAVVVSVMVCSTAVAGNYSGKKILYVDSYSEEFDWSVGITRGIVNTLKDTGVELKIFRMDTKMHNEEEFKKEAALKAKALIEEFKPDVVIASDDNASKYLIVPYYKDAELPFVFCGINYDASIYGFPCKNVTGMLEVSGAAQFSKYMRQLTKGDRCGFISADLLSDHKEFDNDKQMLGNTIGVFAKDFESWKAEFKELQGKVDFILFYTYVGIQGWNNEEAEKFVQENTRIPTGTFLEGTMPYSIVGYVKVPEEQGEWAAKTALKILDGAAPGDIPIAQNERGTVIVNTKLLEKTGISFPFDLIESADHVIK
jgi:ABC-type uncharacterized transport system substrate-binding protein